MQASAGAIWLWNRACASKGNFGTPACAGSRFHDNFGTRKKPINAKPTATQGNLQHTNENRQTVEKP